MISTIIYYNHNGEIQRIYRDTKVALSTLDRANGLNALYVDSGTIPNGPFFIRDDKIIAKEIHAYRSLPKDPPVILIRRDSFGLGDVVTTLGLVQDLRNKYPSSKIVYHIRESYREILERHPAIDLIIIKPQPFDDCFTVELSRPCPSSLFESKNMPYIDKSRIDLWKESIGLSSDTKPKLYLSDNEREWGKSFVEDRKGGLVLRTSENWRNYPSNKVLVEKLKDYGVILIDHQANPFDVKSTNGLNIRQHMSVIDSLKVIITPDTAWLHVAGALDKKIISLFGSVDPKYRSEPYNAISLTGECPYERQPCWYDICVEKREIPPCMNINSNSIILSTELLLG